jgi:two-component system, NarL family, response regulator DesR
VHPAGNRCASCTYAAWPLCATTVGCHDGSVRNCTDGSGSGEGSDRNGSGSSPRSAPPIRVLVAEDMRILRDTLVAVLNLHGDIDVVGEVSDGGSIVAAALRDQPDVAIVDIDLPGVDGLTASADLRERMPDCKILILTVLGNPGNLRRALGVHVDGFLIKDTPAEQLAAAIRRIAAGERVIDQKLALAALEIPQSPLGPRETEVLRLFATGAEPSEIAADVHLSYGTVRNYLASAVTKLGARNRVDAVRIAAEAGWL